MQRRTLLRALAAGGAWPLAARAATFRDVIDTPAAPSALAARGLLVGLARAGRRIVAVGQRGHVLTSDDAGKGWQQATVPVSSDLVAVHFPTPTLGWAVGHDGVVLHSADAGRSWTRQFDGRQLGPQGAENPLLDVRFEDEANGIAVGAFGTVLRTSDGGRQWQLAKDGIDNPKGLHLHAVRRVGADLYIAGEQGLLLKHDGTRSAALATPYPGTLFGVTGNERAVLAYGLRGNVVRSTDGGRSWAAVPTGLGVGLVAGTLDDQGRIVLVGQGGQVLVGSDDGASFSPMKTERAQPAAAVIATGTGQLVLAGPRGVQTLALA
jgi:photosystem II stability/assembly factor-like uncharacterized protein